tara:strand:- start:69 stop:419 length:351 start_codon:yes stop_codon:yes gene_type:complete
MNDTYIYISKGAGADAAGDSVLYPVANFTGVDPISADTTRISFKALTGNAADDDILITHESGKFKEFCQALALALNTDKGGTVIFIDQDNKIFFEELLQNGAMSGVNSDPVITLDT